MVYEAGPTGFGLARALTGAGIACVVAAPSKLHRPAGDRVKTDARDAMLLARLLRLDEIVEVAVPSVEQEAARDLVRAREDARGDLMRARHRLSKLLLRQGIVYTGGKAWTGRPRRLAAAGSAFEPARPLQLAFDADLRGGAADRATGGTGWTRRSQTMAGDSEFTAVMRRLGCLRGVSTLTGFGLAVEIGDWHRFTGATIGAYLGLVPTESSSGALPGRRGRSPRPGTATPAGCWSRRPGTTARPTGPARRCGPAGSRRPPRPGPAAMPATGACTPAGRLFTARSKRPVDRQRRHRPRAGRLVLVTGACSTLTGPQHPTSPRS